ncbi:MAG TPA: hypothetical protein EYQ62_10920, partial [Verrucomicrobiales bacterium]|nr:hypothetical protein [Verrucomicrobiales bacterium]
RDALGMTDGNVTTHIRTLQKAGYVTVAKSFQNKRPLTTCSLTAAGRKAFGEYVGLLEGIVKSAKQSEKKSKPAKTARAAKTKRRKTNDHTNFALQS